jgi:hypothetical protein
MTTKLIYKLVFKVGDKVKAVITTYFIDKSISKINDTFIISENILHCYNFNSTNYKLVK